MEKILFKPHRNTSQTSLGTADMDLLMANSKEYSQQTEKWYGSYGQVVGLHGLSGLSNHNDSVILCAGGNCLRLRKSQGKCCVWVEMVHRTGWAR